MVPGLAMQNRLGSLTLVRVLHHYLTFCLFEEGALGRVDVHKFVSGCLAEVHLLWQHIYGCCKRTAFFPQAVWTYLTFCLFEEGALGRVDVHKFVSGRLAEVHLLWHVFWGASTFMGAAKELHSSPKQCGHTKGFLR